MHMVGCYVSGQFCMLAMGNQFDLRRSTTSFFQQSRLALKYGPVWGESSWVTWRTDKHGYNVIIPLMFTAKVSCYGTSLRGNGGVRLEE